MLISSFLVSVVQNALAVFAPDLERPFNTWSKQAYAQGFSWRPQSVSFLVFEDGDVSVEVHVEQEVSLRVDALRAIVVPFEVPHHNEVEISGIYEKSNRVVQIQEGKYALVFQLGYKGTGSRNAKEQDIQIWCTVSFIPCDSVQPLILKRDADLNPPDLLVMDGKPA
jgi:Competence protein J (ComJ)